VTIRLGLLPLARSSYLKKHVHRFAVPVDCPPTIMLLALNLDKDFVDKKCIIATLIPTSKSSGVPGAKFDTPQSNRLVANRNTTLSHKILDFATAQIEAMLEPDNVLNELGRKLVAFVLRRRSIHPSIADQARLSCQETCTWSELHVCSHQS
jgi:hypothetical protein